MKSVLAQLKNGLIVSCQALPDEPLHSSYIMSRMAVAAVLGGAVGIRANGINDINAIMGAVDVPVIGISKTDYADSDVFITPTFVEVQSLAQLGVPIVAMDATLRKRPTGEQLAEIVERTREQFPKLLLMADCATCEELENACKLGFDIVSSTLVGYTPASQGDSLFADNAQLLKQMLQISRRYGAFFIAEGNVNSQARIKQAIDLEVDAFVIGSAITRPQLITESFSQFIASEVKNHAGI